MNRDRISPSLVRPIIISLVAAATMLIIIALVGASVPVRRATEVDPIHTLRAAPAGTAN